jgi:hypothetical protein
MTQRKEHSWNKWDYENRRTPVWVMMLTSAFVSFVSCFDACLDAVGVRPTLYALIWSTLLPNHTTNINIFLLSLHVRSRDSSVGIATGYELEDWGVGVRAPVGSRIFSSPNRSDRLWGPPNLQSNGYRRLFHRGLKLTTHLQLLPRSRIAELYIHFSIRLHGVVLKFVDDRDNFVSSCFVLLCEVTGFLKSLLLPSSCLK